LRPQNKIDITDFNPANGTPIHTNELTDGQIYVDTTDGMTASQTEPLQIPILSWDDFVRTHPQWIQELLVDVQFYTTEDGRTLTLSDLIEANEKHGFILQVSDGSVRTHDMSFGWIMVTPTGVLLEQKVHATEEGIHCEQKEQACCREQCSFR
jgi:hypothetical protein